MPSQAERDAMGSNSNSAAGESSRAGKDRDRSPGTDRERSDSQSSDPSDRNRPRRKRRKQSALPSEYADFKLADGRTLREVMGDKFFGSAGGSGDGKFMSRGVRERLAKGDAPFTSGKFKNMDPARLAAFKASHPDSQFSQGVSRQAAAEARRAEQQARRDKRRAWLAEQRANRLNHTRPS